MNAHSESGVALPLVIVIIVLASTIVTGVTYSTYMSGRLNASLEQSLKGEYLVKSALNLARVLIQADPTPEESPKDLWAIFKSGQSVPAGLLGIDEPNVKVDLEINSIGAKIPLRCLVTSAGTTNNPIWLERYKRLFEILGFDNDEEVDQTGKFGDRVFKPSEMVANLIDAMDRDSESLSMQGYQGIESDLPNGFFGNKEIIRETEMSRIPGFTPARLQKLLKFISTSTSCAININSASAEVLASLHPDITATQIEEIKKYRVSEQGPFKDRSELEPFISSAAFAAIRTDIDVKNSKYIVLAKAQFLANVTFLKATIDTQNDKGSLPKIVSLELY